MNSTHLYCFHGNTLKISFSRLLTYIKYTYLKNCLFPATVMFSLSNYNRPCTTWRTNQCVRKYKTSTQYMYTVKSVFIYYLHSWIKTTNSPWKSSVHINETQHRHSRIFQTPPRITYKSRVEIIFKNIFCYNITEEGIIYI